MKDNIVRAVAYGGIGSSVLYTYTETAKGVRTYKTYGDPTVEKNKEET